MPQYDDAISIKKMPKGGKLAYECDTCDFLLIVRRASGDLDTVTEAALHHITSPLHQRLMINRSVQRTSIRFKWNLLVKNSAPEPLFRLYTISQNDIRDSLYSEYDYNIISYPFF